MQNKPKQSRRGKRGGSAARLARQKDIHSKLDGRPSGTHSNHAHNLHGSSATAALAEAAKYYNGALIDENREDHIVPRQSITRKQFLGIVPPAMEMEPMQAKQLDKQSGKLIATTDDRLAWKQDETLLRRGDPFKAPRVFKREGSVSVGLNKRKTITSVPEPPAAEGTVLGPEVDIYFRD